MENCGSISHGTMRPEDLIPDFLDCLESQDAISTLHSQLCKRIRTQLESSEDALEEYYASEEAGFDLEELFESLDAYAPPYFYFCAHEGDGSDYGFWLCNQALEEAIHDGTLLKVSDLVDIPEDWTGEVLQVSDHGNLSLYRAKREWVEVWAIV